MIIEKKLDHYWFYVRIIHFRNVSENDNFVLSLSEGFNLVVIVVMVWSDYSFYCRKLCTMSTSNL